MRWEVWMGTDNFVPNYYAKTSAITESKVLSTFYFPEAEKKYQQCKEECEKNALKENKVFCYFCYILEYNKEGAFTIKHSNYFSEAYKKDNPFWCEKWKCLMKCNGNCKECEEELAESDVDLQYDL